MAGTVRATGVCFADANALNNMDRRRSMIALSAERLLDVAAWQVLEIAVVLVANALEELGVGQ